MNLDNDWCESISFIDAFIGMQPNGRMDKNYTHANNTYESL